MTHEVKCANCGSYYPLDQVKQESNGYYCRKCYQARKRRERALPGKETLCAVCGKALASHDLMIKDGGLSYCATCYYQGIGERQGHEEAVNGKAYEETRCSVCGKALVPEAASVLYANARFCIECYDKSTPYLDVKPVGPQLGDALASMRTGEKVLCGKCGRDLGPFDVKVRDGEAVYCEKCFRDARDAPGTRRFFLAEQAGIYTRPGVTSVRDADSLVECTNCGWVITRDRLEKDARGRLRCPHCGKKFDVPAEKRKQKEIRCDVCGKTLTPHDTRVQGGGKSYCPECYGKSIEYRHCGTEGEKAVEKAIVCSVCGRLDMQQRWVHEGKVYCEICNKDIKAGKEKKDDSGKVKTVDLYRQSVTTVADPGKLVTCPDCGIVLTRDRLKENKRGKPCCPKCDKDLSSQIRVPEKTGTEDYSVVAQLFKCLGDPCRVKIIESLSEKELCVFEFVELTGYQYSALSYHLKTLREMDLIKSFERGNFIVYSLTDKGQVIHEFVKKSRELNGEIWLSAANSSGKRR